MLGLGAVVAASAGAQEGRTIDGVVRDSASGETLPSAAVSIPALGLATRTNIDGRFVLVHVPYGPHILRVHYIGYGSRDIPFDTRLVQRPMMVRLTRTPAHLERVAVTGGAKQALDVTSDVEAIAISTQQIATMPSVGEVDVFRSLQMLPGISATSDATSGLYVRGGTPDQNLVLFDGMTVYQVDHFYGIFSAFNADAVKDVRLFPGAYPAEYGGRVSSVVDLTGKSGDEHHLRASGGVGLLSARGEAEIPLGRGSILVAGRRSYSDIIQSSLFEKLFNFASSGSTPGSSDGMRVSSGKPVNVQPSYYFYDLDGKGSYRPTDRDLLAVSYYGGEDHLLESAPGALAGNNLTHWGNQGASVRWFRQWDPRLSSNLIASTSHYVSRGDQGGLVESNAVDDNTLRLDNALQLTQRDKVSAGLWLTGNRSAYDFTVPTGGGVVILGSGDIHLHTSARLAAGYLQNDWTLTDALRLTVGVRAVHYDLLSAWYGEPRASITYRLASEWKLKAAWGRYDQFVNRVENENIATGSRDFWLLADRGHPMTRAEHRLVGVSFDPANYLINVEAYDKILGGVAVVSRRAALEIAGPSATQNDEFFYGNGREQGIELLLQRKFGAFTGWISYTLAQAMYTIPRINGGMPFPADQDQKHEVKAVGSYALGPWTFSSTWVYGSGHPYTAPESDYSITLLNGAVDDYIHLSGKNAERLPSYQRLDVAVFRTFRGASWFDWQIGASIFNVSNHTNLWYRTFDVTKHPVGITDVNNLGFTPSIDLSFSIK